MERRIRRTISLVALAAAASGCGLLRIAGEVQSSMGPGPTVDVDMYEVPERHRQSRFVAGAAEEDITPSPGFPTGGHGPAGALAKGYWIRLRARAFFFEDESGAACALVSADLFAIPGGLKARVAYLVNKGLRRANLDVSLPPEAIVLAATHTHHGPGNFMTAAVYNQFGSSYSGFSRPLFDFLAERIAKAVVEAAVQARRRANPVGLRLTSGKVDYGLVRNRSPRVFLLNVEREAILSRLNVGEQTDCERWPDEPPDHWELEDCPRLRAADRALTVLELAEIGPRRESLVGALVFFAVHPTVLDHQAPLYGPDIFGYASAVLNARWGGPVIGYFNGAEGDVTARRTRRDFADVVILGERLADATARVRSGKPRVMKDPAVAVEALQMHLSEKEQRTCGNGRSAAATLADSAVVGTATLGGAEDDRSALFDLGWKDGVRGKPEDGQGDKMPALDSPLVRPIRLTRDLAPPSVFPYWLPLGSIRIGELRLLSIPFEASTAQGILLRDVAAGSAAAHGTVELIGLANEYGYYLATEDEYGAQDYMGASTLWGPQAGAFLACNVGRMKPVAPGLVRAWQFEPGAEPLEPFGLSFVGDSVTRPDEGLDRVLLDLGGAPERGLPWFYWEEPGPCIPGESGRISQDCRRVSIIHSTPSGWEVVDDDRGTRFFTAAMDRNGSWAAIWLSPLLERAARMKRRTGSTPPSPILAGKFAFVVDWQGAPRWCSESFAAANGKTIPSGPIPVKDSCDEYRMK